VPYRRSFLYKIGINGGKTPMNGGKEDVIREEQISKNRRGWIPEKSRAGNGLVPFPAE